MVKEADFHIVAFFFAMSTCNSAEFGYIWKAHFPSRISYKFYSILVSVRHLLAAWHNGIALDSSPKDWGFNSLCGHFVCFEPTQSGESV